MTESEFTAGPHKYRAGRMTTFQQLHVARKMATSIIYTGGMLKAANDFDANQFAKTIAATSAPMSDADLESCILSCFSVVSRYQAPPGVWSPLVVSNAMMFDDLHAQEMLEIVFHVMRTNKLLDFFVVSPPASGEEGSKDRKSSGPRSRTVKPSSTDPLTGGGADTNPSSTERLI